LSGMIGQEGATGIQALIESANQPAKGLVATAVSIVVLVVGATTVFAELQSALDRIWQVPQRPNVSGIWAVLRSRVLSLGFILGLGFLLLVSLVSSAAIAALGSWASGLLPGWEALLQLINVAFSLGFSTLLFAMIFKIMPQAKVSWNDVWVGAGVTAVLFEIGKMLISLYIGKSSVTSSFAAAGSLVVLLVWVYYSAQIFLLGAEFTWVFANDHGSLAKDEKSADAPAEAIEPSNGNDKPKPVLASSLAQNQNQNRDDTTSLSRSLSLQAPESDDSSQPVLSSNSARPHVTLKQRAIVYGGSAAIFVALRLLLKRLLKRKSRRLMDFPHS
jgi:membrane protein